MENRMKFILQSVTETQKNSLDATASLTNTCLVITERLARLNLEISRTAFEKSSEITLLYLHDYISRAKNSADRANFAQVKQA